MARSLSPGPCPLQISTKSSLLSLKLCNFIQSKVLRRYGKLVRPMQKYFQCCTLSGDRLSSTCPEANAWGTRQLYTPSVFRRRKHTPSSIYYKALMFSHDRLPALRSSSNKVTIRIGSCERSPLAKDQQSNEKERQLSEQTISGYISSITA